MRRLDRTDALTETVNVQLGVEELVNPVVDRTCFFTELPRDSEDCISFVSRTSAFLGYDRLPRQEEMCVNFVAKLPRELEEMALAVQGFDSLVWER